MLAGQQLDRTVMGGDDPEHVTGDDSNGLDTLGCPDDGAAELIDQIARLENLKGAVAAAQARATAVLAARQRAERQSAGVSAPDRAKGLGAEMPLARRESPYWGARHLGLAEALVHEMPFALATLEAGQISEWRATLIERETACLTVEHRRQVDAELATRPGGLAALGDLEARLANSPSPRPCHRHPDTDGPHLPQPSPAPGWSRVTSGSRHERRTRTARPARHRQV